MIVEGILYYASEIGKHPDSVAQAVDARMLQIPRFVHDLLVQELESVKHIP